MTDDRSNLGSRSRWTNKWHGNLKRGGSIWLYSRIRARTWPSRNDKPSSLAVYRLRPMPLPFVGIQKSFRKSALADTKRITLEQTTKILPGPAGA